MPRALAGFAVTLALGAAIVLALGMSRGSALVYTPGVTPYSPVVSLNDGDETCQAPIDPPTGARFSRVRLFVGTAPPAVGPPLEVTIRPLGGGAPLARGRLAGGYRAGSGPLPVAVAVPGVRSDRAFAVCVADRGLAPLILYGTGGIASPYTSATFDGAPTPYDLSVRLERAHRQSLLSLIPAMARRASLFKARLLSAGVLIALGLLAVAGVPALLGAALKRAEAADARGPG